MSDTLLMLLEIMEGVLGESRNTLGADVNEILLALIASDSLGGDTSKFINYEEAFQTINQRKTQLTAAQKSAELEIQSQRAIKMFEEIEDWRQENGFEGEITKVWWTARPNVLVSAVPAAELGNPSDVLYEINGTEYLGISAKSTKTKQKIGFKNHGVGWLVEELGLNIDKINKSVENFIVGNKLSRTAAMRKKFLRAPENKDIRIAAEKHADQIVNQLRDILLERLKELPVAELRAHLYTHWLDASPTVYPYYVQSTGYGMPGKSYGAMIMDPINNEKYKSLMGEDVEIVPVGTNSIGIKSVNGTKIMKIRFKYADQKLASSLKLSGDPW
jgi:hypothetical protein